MRTTDIAIVGAGVMGCAVAYNLLKRNPALRVTIVERDSTYRRASTALSDGNTRVQFNVRENILISLYGLEMIARFDAEMASAAYTPRLDFRQQGNLFLVSAAQEAQAREGLRLQQELGGAVRWVEADGISDLYPLYAGASVSGATFGACDGTFSPLDLLLGYRHKALELGAEIIETQATALQHRNGRVHGLTLDSGDTLAAPIVVNCAGAWAQILAATAGIRLPIAPIKRQVYIVETDYQGDAILPLLLLPSGAYIIHEGGGRFLIGASRADDPVTSEDFSWSRSRFEEYIWEDVVTYLPAFDRLKLVNGWAGLYAVNTFDGNAILGEWPEMGGLFLANGFSGHGLQQAHAVGRYLAELILSQPPALDLSRFSPARILAGEPVFENKNRLI